jgi:CubicO group peptidase (beta-lactamase class C family)
MTFWRAWGGTFAIGAMLTASNAGLVLAGDGTGQNAVAKGNGNQQKLEAAVDEVFQDLNAAGSPGCALGVYRGGQMIYEKGYGLANIEENVPISPKSVFDIGSTSKQFTATSILLLEKAGKLSVDDDVHKYIPELPDYGKKITILNLLNHTSGLRDYLTLFDIAGDAAPAA